MAPHKEILLLNPPERLESWLTILSWMDDCRGWSHVELVPTDGILRCSSPSQNPLFSWDQEGTQQSKKTHFPHRYWGQFVLPPGSEEEDAFSGSTSNPLKGCRANLEADFLKPSWLEDSTYWPEEHPCEDLTFVFYLAWNKFHPQWAVHGPRLIHLLLPCRPEHSISVNIMPQYRGPNYIQWCFA